MNFAFKKKFFLASFFFSFFSVHSRGFTIAIFTSRKNGLYTNNEKRDHMIEILSFRSTFLGFSVALREEFETLFSRLVPFDALL